MRENFVPYLLLLTCVSVFVSACGDSLDPETPEGALNSFARALTSADEQAIYAHLSAPSKQSLSDLSALSNLLNDKIKALPLEAQPWAKSNAMPAWMVDQRALSGVNLFSLMSNEASAQIKRLPAEQVEQSFRTTRVISESGDGQIVRLKTRALPQVIMRKEGARWSVASFEEPLAQAVATTQNNIKALKQSQVELERRVKLNLPMPTASQAPDQ
jgi:hypothetical protein